MFCKICQFWRNLQSTVLQLPVSLTQFHNIFFKESLILLPDRKPCRVTSLLSLEQCALQSVFKMKSYALLNLDIQSYLPTSELWVIRIWKLTYQIFKIEQLVYTKLLFYKQISWTTNVGIFQFKTFTMTQTFVCALEWGIVLFLATGLLKIVLLCLKPAWLYVLINYVLKRRRYVLGFIYLLVFFSLKPMTCIWGLEHLNLRRTIVNDQTDIVASESSAA